MSGRREDIRIGAVFDNLGMLLTHLTFKATVQHGPAEGVNPVSWGMTCEQEHGWRGVNGPWDGCNM